MASVLWARLNHPGDAADHARAVQIADCYLRGRGLAWPAERPRPWRVLPESWLRQVELEYDGGRAICRRPEWTAAVVLWPFLSAPCADRPNADERTPCRGFWRQGLRAAESHTRSRSSLSRSTVPDTLTGKRRGKKERA